MLFWIELNGCYEEKEGIEENPVRLKTKIDSLNQRLHWGNPILQFKTGCKANEKIDLIVA